MQDHGSSAPTCAREHTHTHAHTHLSTLRSAYSSAQHKRFPGYFIAVLRGQLMPPAASPSPRQWLSPLLGLANRSGSEGHRRISPLGAPPLPLPAAGPARVRGPQAPAGKTGLERPLRVWREGRFSGKGWRENPATTAKLRRARWRGHGGRLILGVAVGPIGCLLGPGEAEAAYSGIREPPAARPRRDDWEAHTAVSQPAAVALV